MKAESHQDCNIRLKNIVDKVENAAQQGILAAKAIGIVFHMEVRLLTMYDFNLYLKSMSENSTHHWLFLALSFEHSFSLLWCINYVYIHWSSKSYC